MRRDELAEFLRHHRERTSPASVGIDASGRRRTPGLRREEVSQLAGVGLSWYTWLEQGRDIMPSESVLDALARVLDLDAAERTHLYDLAGVALPASGEPYPTEAPQELLDIVAGLEPNPAYLLDPRTDVLAWNAGALRVLGDPSLAPDGARNLLWWLFTDRKTHPSTWATTGRRTLARFRAEHARHFGDPAFLELIVRAAAGEPGVPRAVAAARGARRPARHEGHRPPGAWTSDPESPSVDPTSHPALRLTQLVPADVATRRALA